MVARTIESAPNASKDKAPRRRGKRGDKGASQSFQGSKSLPPSPRHSNPSKKATGVGGGEVSIQPHTSTRLLLVPTANEANSPHYRGWYDMLPNPPNSKPTSTTTATTPPPLTPTQLQSLRTQATTLYSTEITNTKRSQSQSPDSQDAAWIEQTMKRGTLRDRIASMSVLISDYPCVYVSALDELVGMTGVGVQSRIQSMAGEALVDLWKGGRVIPLHRKLQGLTSRTLPETSTNATLTPRVVLLWTVEDKLRHIYHQFLSNLQNWIQRDPSDSHRIYGMKLACGVLTGVVEGEGVLLEMVANKLGDPIKKVASAAGHELRRVLEIHGAMTGVVAREVQQLAHRPHLSSRALYNCIIFLNQLRLSSQDPTLPVSLIKTYFRLFEVAIGGVSKTSQHSKRNKSKQKTEDPSENHSKMKSRLLGALLTGVNRAHPFLPTSEGTEDTGMEQHIDALYRIVHLSDSHSASVQSLLLLYNLVFGTTKPAQTPTTSQIQTLDPSLQKKQGRYYTALYAKLNDPQILNGKSRMLTMFFNVLYKSMKRDECRDRVVALTKRLLHNSFHTGSANVVAGALFLVSEVGKVQPCLRGKVVDNGGMTGGRREFDPLKRDPRFAFSTPESTPTPNTSTPPVLWEMALLSQHYHPTVSKFTSATVSSPAGIVYHGDPLRDFQLGPFLDKFAYRHAKTIDRSKTKTKDPDSKTKPKSKTLVGARADAGGRGGNNVNVPMNHPDASHEKKEGSETFYRQFFAERARREELRGTGRNDDKSGDGFDGAMEGAESNLADLDENDEDDEEEQFVAQLGEKLMNEHAAKTGTKAHFDDEDPDTEGWDFSENDDETETEEQPKSFADMDGFAPESDDDENTNENNDDDDDDEEDAYLESEESEAEDDTNTSKRNTESAFGDASDYEEMIAKGWSERDELNKKIDEEISRSEGAAKEHKKRRK